MQPAFGKLASKPKAAILWRISNRGPNACEPCRCGQAGHVNPQLTDMEAFAAEIEAETGVETRIIARAEHVYAAQGSGMSP